MRAVRRLIVTLVILFALFVAADRIAVHVAEGRAADRIQQSEHLGSRPDVSIEGFPFLTQVAARRLDSVRLTADGVAVGGGGRSVTLRSFSAHLTGVRFDPGFDSATARDATGGGLITYRDLSHLLPHGIKVGYGGSDHVKVTGTVDILGQPLTGSATAALSVRNGDVLRVDGLRIDGIDGIPDISAVPGAEPAFRALFSASQRLTGIPAGLRLESVRAESAGVRFSFAGHDLRLAG